MKKLFTKKTRFSPKNNFGVPQSFNKGFTLVEMLTVLAIFFVITAVVLFEYGRFNSETIMTNMAYEVALATRQAQVFSLGVRGQTGDDNFDNRYGVYFNLDKTPPKDFVFFVDKGEEDNQDQPNSFCDDNTLDATGDCFACISTDECEEKLSLTRDIEFSSICLAPGNDPLGDEGACNGDNVSQATITFQRPYPDAIIRDTTDLEEDSYNSAAIIIKNKFDGKRAVIIKSTGQISVEVINN